MPVTRSSTSRQLARRDNESPYAGRPASPPSASKRTGIRGLLSNLIWGTPTKAEADEGEEEGGQSDDDQDQAAGKTPDDAHVISDDDDDEEEGTTQGVLDAQRKQTAYTSSQKGKGKEFGSRVEGSRLNNFSSLRHSTTLGDFRSYQAANDEQSDQSFVETPGRATMEEERNGSLAQQPSPADINSTLASFFAEKGTATLTADEKRMISELLAGGRSAGNSRETAGLAAARATPTAFTPSFSFSVQPPRTSRADASILSPGFSGLRRSTTTSNDLSQQGSFTSTPSAPPQSSFSYRSGLTGSQSLSSLASLTAPSGPGGAAVRLPAAANPRSAVNRRAAARPSYLGAGYSSQAIARRKRAAQQVQMGGLYNSLDSFASKQEAVSTVLQPETPGKRRRLADGSSTPAAPSPPTAAATSLFGSPAPSVAVPPFNRPAAPSAASSLSASPVSTAPQSPQQPSLFKSAPHLKAKFANSTPVKPSPLRQAEAAVSSPTTPGSPAGTPNKASPPRTSSRTADLMKDILGDTRDRQAQSAPQPVEAKTTTTDPFLIIRGEQTPIGGFESPAGRKSTRVPRESLVKQPSKLTPMEMLEKSMPPELRNATPNGKPSRPKPPPVPGSARKTRAAAAAEAKEAKEKAEEKTKPSNTREQQKRTSKRGKSAGKTDDESGSAPPESAPLRASKSDKDTAGDAGASTTPAPQAFSFSPSTSSAAPSQKAAFSFGVPADSTASAPATSTPAPSLFSGVHSAAAPAAEPSQKAKSTSPMFSFTPPAVTAGEESAPKAAPAPPSGKERPNPVLDVTSANPKQAALKIPAISLPSFPLYDTAVSFGMQDGEQDLAVEAIKDTVREMPLNELMVYDLL